MRYFLWFSYDGTAYHGWQVQPYANSVQAEIQTALSTILRNNVEVVGAGRTDAGVHARRMSAHFDFDGDIDCKQLTYKLNRLLPNDISIERVEIVSSEMHARFSATARTYHYYIHLCKNPFLRAYSYETHFNLNFDLMNIAAEMLLKYNDFASFCKSHTDVKTTICNVTEAKWIRIDENSYYFRITANRFLRNMVRAVVGTLVEVGRGRISLEEFQRIVEGKDRCKAGESMPGHALFLEDVRY
jgi:tRNA pseudouridine38-40 synthase